MPSNRDIASTATVIRGGKYPFKNFTTRDRAYLNFWAALMDQHGGSVTIAQIANAGELPAHKGSNKPHDGGVANRFVRAGLITKSQDGHVLTLTEKGRLTLANREVIAEAGAENEIDRLKRFGQIASRPGQEKFSRDIRRAYLNKCAVTGCATGAALEAAHIRTQKAADDNQVSNGILLRADIHALFDAGLITLTADGLGVESSPLLKDSTYRFLRDVRVFRPEQNAPSSKNISHHRARFGYTT